MSKLYNKPQHIRVMVTETVPVRRLDVAALVAALATAPLTPAQRGQLSDRADDPGALLDLLRHYHDQAAPAARAALHALCARIAAGELHPEVTETREVETWEWVDPEDPRVAPAIRTQAAAQRLAGIGGGR